MDLFDNDDQLIAAPEQTTRRTARHPAGHQVDGLARDNSFPARVAALLRSRPIIDLAAGADRQGWPTHTYDVTSLALAAIDLVIAKQGFEEEATYLDVVHGLEALVRRAAPDQPVEEHAKVARFTVDGLLNTAEREIEFAYQISDYTEPGVGHQQRQVRFRLLKLKEDPIRGESVLEATKDAINALVGGLEFDVEDEQVAAHTLLERQLERGAFDAAERAALRARYLSVALANDLTQLIKDTRRDLRSVLGEWVDTVPASLDRAREHIAARMEVEHRLLTKVRETLTASDTEVAATSARIATMLDESAHRHQSLHKQVITARGVFLDEQDRQSFRPPAIGYLPDLAAEVLTPALALTGQDADEFATDWLTDVAGPRAPRIPRLYRLINDLWTIREPDLNQAPDDPEDDIGDPDPPVLRPAAITAAHRAVATVGLPARLSRLIATCLADPVLDEADRQQAAEIVTLAVLWCFSPEDPDDDEHTGQDLATRILGPGAVADLDNTPLMLPGWTGDDLIVAPTLDLLDADGPALTPATTVPEPVHGDGAR